MNIHSNITSFHQLNAIYDGYMDDLKTQGGHGLPAFHDPIANQVFSLRSLEDQSADVLRRMNQYAALYAQHGLSGYMQCLAALLLHPGADGENSIKLLAQHLVSESGRDRYVDALNAGDPSSLDLCDVMKFQSALNAMDRSRTSLGNAAWNDHVQWVQTSVLPPWVEFDWALDRLVGDHLQGGGAHKVGWSLLDASLNASVNALGYFSASVLVALLEKHMGAESADLNYLQRLGSELVNRLVQQAIRFVGRDMLWPACQSSLGIPVVSLESASKGRQWGQLGIAVVATVGCDMLGAVAYGYLPQQSGKDAIVQGGARAMMFAGTDFIALFVRGVTARTSKGARLVVNENFMKDAKVAGGIRGVQVILDSCFLPWYKLSFSNLYGLVAVLDACELTPYLVWEGRGLCRATPSEQPVRIELGGAQAVLDGAVEPQADVSQLTVHSRISRINIP